MESDDFRDITIRSHGSSPLSQASKDISLTETLKIIPDAKIQESNFMEKMHFCLRTLKLNLDLTDQFVINQGVSDTRTLEIYDTVFSLMRLVQKKHATSLSFENHKTIIDAVIKAATKTLPDRHIPQEGEYSEDNPSPLFTLGKDMPSTLTSTWP